jgi:tetratricopeptide (TPR) repeat protein
MQTRAKCYRLEAARIILVNAVERLPDIAIFHYNLACYECLLGNLETAKARLQHAFKLEPRYRLQALEDEDLQLLWNSI